MSKPFILLILLLRCFSVSSQTITANPNPLTSTTSITFSIDSTWVLSAEVYNLVGKSVKIPFDSSNFQSGMHQFLVDLSDQPDGIYLLRLFSGNKNLSALKLIKSTTTALSENITPGLFLYPNPVRDHLYLNKALSVPLKFSWYNVNGTLLREDELAPGTDAIDCHELPPGFYLLRCSIEGNHKEQKILRVDR